MTTTQPNAADITAALADGATVADLTDLAALEKWYGPLGGGDFAALFPTAPMCDNIVAYAADPTFVCTGPCCPAVHVTARQGHLMHAAGTRLLRTLHSLALDGAAALGAGLAQMLPPVCTTYTTNPVWVTQFVHTLYQVTATIGHGHIPAPSTTAAEMCLHLVLAAAGADLEDGTNSPDLEHMPVEAGDLGEDPFAALAILLFADHDVLMLFQPELDGLENSVIAEAMGMVNLHPKDWFTPFAPKPSLTPTLHGRRT